MRSSHRVPAGLALLLPLVCLRAADAQTTYTPEQLHRHFQNVANAYDIRRGGERLDLRSQPLMHWQNTIRKQEQGALYMWEKDGRPQVLASIFTFQGEDGVRCRHEMISLADAPLTSKLDAATVWSPKQAGVTWKPFTAAPPPSESAPRRLTQMRAIAREYSAVLELPGQQPSNLTLIPQPMVRYSSPEHDVIDGVVFSMAVVTDPEVLLMIEARKQKGGRRGWYYAAARAHYQHVELEHKGQKVWEAPAVQALENTQAGQLPHAHDGYFIFFPAKELPLPEDLR